jgi:pimeloyl-ACP methyl ester carboxylesterase
MIGRARTISREYGVEAARLDWFNKADWFKVIRENPEQCRAQEHLSLITDFAGGPWLDNCPMKKVLPVRENLGRITRPVLLVNGEHDLPDFLQIAEELVSKLPNVKCTTISGAGGFPLLEYPYAVNARISHFIAECEATA